MTTNPDHSVLIAVAPNGARRGKEDHTAIPLSCDEIAETALACAAAGAGMIHLHVRDEQGGHSLDPARYRQAITAVKERVGDGLLIQVSSEAAGKYSAAEQIRAMQELMPDCVSLGLREYIRDESAVAAGSRFLQRLHANGTLIQYILYNPEDIAWYRQLCRRGVIPEDRHMLLFVVGRYGQQAAQADQLADYVSALKTPPPWMVCAFGANEHLLMQEAIELGGHCRVGFENNLELPGGGLAPDNAALVRSTAERVVASGLRVADSKTARCLFQRRQVATGP